MMGLFDKTKTKRYYDQLNLDLANVQNFAEPPAANNGNLAQPNIAVANPPIIAPNIVDNAEPMDVDIEPAKFSNN